MHELMEAGLMLMHVHILFLHLTGAFKQCVEGDSCHTGYLNSIPLLPKWDRHRSALSSLGPLPDSNSKRLERLLGEAERRLLFYPSHCLMENPKT